MKPFAHKPRVAFFDFACCEGCQLTVLEMEEKLFKLLAHVEVVAWREVMSGKSEQYDIAFCEGSITRQEDIAQIKSIRDNAGILVSLGTCASISCHNALKNRWNMDEVVELVYGAAGSHINTIPARPITDVVDVDYQVRGCPLSQAEFEVVFKLILTGQTYTPPNEPVCVECKRNDTLCVYEKGMICLGPLTRCGLPSAPPLATPARDAGADRRRQYRGPRQKSIQGSPAPHHGRDGPEKSFDLGGDPDQGQGIQRLIRIHQGKHQ